jgi:putative FmdB family regulatory protein
VPIYEYVCSACAHRFEVKQRLSDAPVERCVQCGAAVNRVISAPAIMFKGTGWYVTDYSDKLKAPSDSPASNGDAAKPGASADGTKDGTKKETQTPATGAPGAAGSENKPSGAKESASTAASSPTPASPSPSGSSSPKSSGSSN